MCENALQKRSNDWAPAPSAGDVDRYNSHRLGRWHVRAGFTGSHVTSGQGFSLVAHSNLVTKVCVVANL